MDAEPLRRGIYNRAIKLGVTHIRLSFSGGDDQGYLDVNLDTETQTTTTDKTEKLDVLTKDIEDWAWEVYSYSGAGDGSRYGDDIEYDLVNRKATTSEWHEVRQDYPSEPETFKLK